MRLYFAIPGDPDTLTGGYAYDRRLAEELERLGWEVRRVDLPGDYPRPDADARQEATRALAAIPDGERVLIDGLAGGVLPGELAAEGGRLALFALVHHPLADETGLAPDEAERFRSSERAALAAVHGVICPSRTIASRLKDEFHVAAARVTVGPPGTDPGKRAARGNTPPLILSVGSLIPRKRHDVLVAALALLGGRCWRARIVGADDLDPGWAAGLRRRIVAAGLTESVEVVGAVADARAEYCRADLFVSASEYEGYGMACAEALAHGLPVVAARFPAVEEVVPSAAGALVPPGDAEQMAAALAGMLDDRGRADACSEAAWQAGHGLPCWQETAARAAAVLSA